MTWQIALLFNAVFSTIRSGIQKKVVNRVDPQLFLFYVICYISVEMLLLYLLLYHRMPALYFEMIFLGIVFCISTICLFSAIKISLSQTSLFGTYSIILPMLLAALFLGESKLFDPATVRGARSVIGVISAVISLWLLAKSGMHSKYQVQNRNWLYFILIYIILDGAGQYWNKIFLVDHQPVETLISQNLGFLLFLFLTLKLRKLSFRFPKTEQTWTIIDSLAEVGFAVFLLLSYKLGPISIILPIQKITTIIGGMFLGLFLFGEKGDYTKNKVAGLIIGMAGILILVV